MVCVINIQENIYNDIIMDTFFKGLIFGFIVVIVMKNVPIFHGFDSNDVKRVLFDDENGKKYMLVPEKVDC